MRFTHFISFGAAFLSLSIPMFWSTVADGQVTSQELLAKYRAAIEVTSSQAIRSETYTETQDRSLPELRTCFEVDEARRDSQGRVDITSQQWWDVPKGTSAQPTETVARIRQIFDGKYQYKYIETDKLATSSITRNDRDVERARNEYLSMAYPGAALDGHFTGDLLPLAVILQDPKYVQVRPEKEEINGSACYVLDVVTKQGGYTLWIDPNRDFNISQAKATKSGNDEFLGRESFKPLGSPSTVIQLPTMPGEKPRPPLVAAPLNEFVFAVKNVQYKQIDGHWVPVEADFETTRNYTDGTAAIEKIHHKRTEIDLRPDFEKLQAFQLQARDGTPVRTEGQPLPRMEWRGGELVPTARQPATRAGRGGR